jgi:16S rRNA (adenine1518-N6/adenine1519-N6)-dimethyltransferase
MTFFAKKSLGQHFLNSKHVLGQIIATAQIKKGEIVLEIGPGTGILTEGLLEAGAKVIAIEKDHRAIELLQTKFEVASHSGQLVVIEGDVLDQTFHDQLPIPDLTAQAGGRQAMSNREYSVIANIPYYITGAILEKFLEHEPRPNRMVLLVQKEVAERIVAIPLNGSAKESILSISVKAFGTPKLVALVPRGAFTPAPTVDSAILSISNISNRRFVENNVDITRFFQIVRTGFAHKRKFLQSNLEPIIPNETLAQIWQNLELDPKIRAEDISVDKWFEIARM